MCVLHAQLVSGAIGNVIPGVLFNPANVIKVRYMEVTLICCQWVAKLTKKDPKTTRTVHQMITHVYQTEGLGAFKKGLGATLLRDSIWGMVYFPLYTYVRFFPRLPL